MVEIICAWCSVLIRKEYWGEERHGDQSHGMCRSCRGVQIENFKKVYEEAQQDDTMAPEQMPSLRSGRKAKLL